MGFQKMYGFEGVCQSEVQVSIYELSVLGGPLHTSWSDLVGVRQLSNLKTGKQVFFQKNCVIKGIPYNFTSQSTLVEVQRYSSILHQSSR